MGMYVMFMKNAFRENYIYRANTLIYIFTGTLGLLIQFNIWQAVYAAHGTVDNISLAEMLTYVILTAFVSPLTRSNIGFKLGEKIRSGEIAGDFIRPISLKWYLFADQLGNSVYDIFLQLIPTGVMLLLYQTFLPPKDFFHSGMFFLTILLGILLAYSLNYFLGLFVFWVKNYGFISWFLRAFTMLFAGSAVPLWFYPPALQAVANVLPFRFIAFEPISIYLGKTPVDEIWAVVVGQIIWIAVFLIASHLLWKKAQKVITVQGG